MEEVKILVYALVSFLSQEQIPIVAESAEIEINVETKQITLHQYDLKSVEQYRELAKTGLDSLMRTHSLNANLAPITMTSKHMYEDEGKLNATLYLQYKDLKDLRKISFYADADGNLSYPYIEEYSYHLEGGRIDGRHLRFDADQDVKFRMERSRHPVQKTYSMAEDWIALETQKFVDVSDVFSIKDYQKVRKFIFKNGDLRTYRNFDNDNPHYHFEGFDVYLGTGGQRNNFHPEKNKIADYTELVIQDEGYHTLFLATANKSAQPSSLTKNKVYWHNSGRQKKEVLNPYLEKMLFKIKNN